MIEIAFDETEKKPIAVIKVLGIGGAGGNTVNSMIESGTKNIEFIVANTDAQALEHSKAAVKIQMGIKSTKGLGTGANPELGKRSAEEDMDKILESVADADIVFLTAGMGGGTGSGSVPVIARALREQGILSIAVVTKPFTFEGKRRERVANEAIERLRQDVDTLIVIPNQKLIEVVDRNVSMIDAFAMINSILSQSVTGISDIITKPGHINVDFADVRTIMKDMGFAVLGTGRATGANRAREATLQAISSPLLENMSIDGARGVLLNITGGKNLALHEISDAASIIYEKADQDANIILGSVIDESLTDEVCVIVIATGFTRVEKAAEPVKAVDVPALPKIELVSVVAAAPVVEQKVAAVQLVVEAKAEEPIEPATKAFAHEELEEETLTQSAHESNEDEIGLQAEQATHAQEQDDAQEVHAAEHAEQEAIEAQAADILIDLNDLDIPAYLRKEAQK